MKNRRVWINTMDEMNASNPNTGGPTPGSRPAGTGPPPKIEFRIFGEEMIAKEVKPSGKSGRVYLPSQWVGKQVKIVRID